ncbi:MAG: DEAD/DEAH box helicase family protein [Gammaproteobacteria bacterium]|nr:DEAD/DEAH box helicase family protein [Gammaproteobacteria bacterium]
MDNVATATAQEPTLAESALASITHTARPFTEKEQIAWQWLLPANMSAYDHLAWLILRWRLDPVAFGIEALRIVIQPYQAQILLDLADAPLALYEFYGLNPANAKRQVIVPSGHGLGKTRVLAIAIWWHLITHPFSKTICTAPTSDQLTGQLWGEVRKMYRRLKKRWSMIAADWEILGSSITHRNPDNGDWMCIARTARPEKPEGLQGAHALDDDDPFGELADFFGEESDDIPSGGILIIAEEASGIDDAIREVLEGALSEDGARFLAMGNPTRPDGWFAEAMDNPQRYGVVNLDCRMSNRENVYELPFRHIPQPGKQAEIRRYRIRGFVQPKYWENLLRECDGDEDHDRIRVRVRGMKPRSAFEQCIKTHWIEDAFKREPDQASKSESVVLGLDFGLTSDKHSIGARQGFNCLDGEEWLPKEKPEEITLDAAQRAIDWQELYRAKFIIGDANGVGRGAMEYLAKYFHQDRPELGVRVILFNSGTGAADNKRFYRRRDEMWFKEGRKFFANPRCYARELPGLKAQLTQPGFHEDASRRIKVETKKEIKSRLGEEKGASGNLAEGFLHTLMVHVPEHKEAKKKQKPEEFFHPAIKKHFSRLRARMYDANFIR